MKGRLDSRPFSFSLQHYVAQRFIPRSQNKLGGTAKYQEHQLIPFVVGVGNADT
jgi:hypothetical protein